MGTQKVAPGGAEWVRAWDAPRARTGDADRPALCADCGEEWEHMGVEEREGALVHVFRHRHHPTTGGRRYEFVPYEGNGFEER